MSQASYYKSLTEYFRRSVIDAERLSPNTKALLDSVKPQEFSRVKKDAPFAVSSSIWQLGQLDEQTTQSIFTTLKVSKKIQQVDIVLMPRVDLIQVSSGHAIGQQSKIITPILTQVRLSRSGELSPSDKPPFVPREWLAPNQSDQIPFGNVATMDAFITQNPFNAASWSELTDYCDRMLTSLVNDTLEENTQEPKRSLFDIHLLDDYQIKAEISLVLLEPPIIAGFHILKIYDAIIRGTKLNTLYKKAFSTVNSETKTYVDLTHKVDDCAQHVGQMTAEFPLADKQRNALHYINRMQKGDLLAVNGPPGTGKTTLLRSVVADSWVRSALAGKEPPIIVAASSSNQAVTNILDSFSKIEETCVENELKGRWLPHIDSYGLYACGDNKANSKNPYAYLTKKGAGMMELMETELPIADMTSHFLTYFNLWHSRTTGSDIEKATTILHNELTLCVNLQRELQQRFLLFQQLSETCQKLYGSEEKLAQYINSQLEQKNALDNKLLKSKGQIDPFLEQWQSRSLFELIFSFLPFIKSRWWLKNEILARKLDLELIGTTDDHVRAAIASKVSDIDNQLKEVVADLESARTFQIKLNNEKERFISLLSQANIAPQKSKFTYADLVNEVDVKLRFKAFKLATHYWEARWLHDIAKGIEKPKTPDERIEAYRRYSKLTPCFVSTFNMLPNFFEVSEKDGDSWKSTPLVDGADLLIVDEAGQALPHIAGASFLIAKKALLVGDIYQIEPVWSLSKGIDRANLTLNSLLTSQLDYESFWLKSELLASSGNLMKVAHRQTYYQQFQDLENGLYLTEHRRCYDSIIQYCNKLVYQGHLEPLRGESKEAQLLPTMGFVGHESVSQRVGTSKTNIAEAKFICRWIIENQERFASKGPIGESIAIITPFKMQEKTIRRELNNHGLSDIKVGTVHVFQGAECDVILFSSVYASNDSGGSKFYDRGSNMMNVVVSRAKNAFIVFGDNNGFGADSESSPSGLLKQYLVCDSKEEVQKPSPVSFVF
jgi:hypothetical protein